MTTATEVCPGESELIEHLSSEIELVSIVAVMRRENQHDTAYDHFLYDYVGDPVFSRQPPIVRHHPFVGERDYTKRLLASYSKQGSLVVVRETHKMHPEHRPQDFFVATADLHEGVITEWRVAEAVFEGAGDNLKLELILSEKPFDEVVPNASIEASDPLRRIIEQKRALAARSAEEASQPRVILTSQGCWFSKDGTDQEPLAPINELVRRIDDMYARFGHIALLHTERPETETADTIAA